MGLVDEYRTAQRAREFSHLRRAFALRAMVVDGMSQRSIAHELGVSQSAISQQLKSAPDLSHVTTEELLDAASPILKRLAEDRGFSRLAVFGSVARQESGPNSDVDLLVEAPGGTTITRLLALRDLFADVLARRVDLVTYGGLKATVDDDIRRDAVLL